MHILGIDTSCYTSSAALMDKYGNLVSDQRLMLSVPLGAIGLKQSDMVFQHSRNIPLLLETIMTQSAPSISAIGVSNCPRALPDSYMPAFTVGFGYARVVAVSMGVPLITLSHQINHVAAGLWSAQGPDSKAFLAVHASGGTTEIIKVSRKKVDFIVELLGKTIDLAAGQFIDRIGVLLGLPFPAGPHLEQLADQSKEVGVTIPIAVRGRQISFSGPETHVRRLLEGNNIDRHAVASGVQYCIARSLYKLIANTIIDTKIKQVLLTGGVMANKFVNSYVANKLTEQLDAEIFVPKSCYSSDNAVGAAYYAMEKTRRA